MLTGGVSDGLFVKPTIIVDLPYTATQYCQEIFGPVVVVNVFDTEDEVVHLANDTRYGLNAMVFTENLSRAHRVAAKLKAGTVWVNCFFIRDLRAPSAGSVNPASDAKAATSPGSSSPNPRPWSYKSIGIRSSGHQPTDQRRPT